MITTAFCSCFNGSEGRCKHFSALVHKINTEDTSACTSNPLTWNKPPKHTRYRCDGKLVAGEIFNPLPDDPAIQPVDIDSIIKRRLPNHKSPYTKYFSSAPTKIALPQENVLTTTITLNTDPDEVQEQSMQTDESYHH